MNGASIRVATYNVHGGIGVDRTWDGERVADVIGETRADVVGLQEVSADANGDLFRLLAGRFKGYAVEGPTLVTGERRYGNLLLSRWPVVDFDVVDLAYRTREPRNAIQAVVDGPAGPFRVIATHFGLHWRERWSQAKLIADLVGQHRESPLVILGDFNDWPPLSRAGRLIRRSLGLRFRGARRLRTFPSRWPLLALDRILVRPVECLTSSRAHRSPLSRIASDHLPVVADLRDAA